MPSETKPLFRVQFFNQGSVYEVYAKGVSQGGLFGFVEIEELVFNERSKVVIDPAEERLKAEFEGVKRFYVPMHAVVRIDEVEREGVARVTEPKESGRDSGARVTPFPIYTPRGDRS